MEKEKWVLWIWSNWWLFEKVNRDVLVRDRNEWWWSKGLWKEVRRLLLAIGLATFATLAVGSHVKSETIDLHQGVVDEEKD